MSLKLSRSIRVDTAGQGLVNYLLRIHQSQVEIGLEKKSYYSKAPLQNLFEARVGVLGGENQATSKHTHRILCSARINPSKPGRVLSVTWTFSLFAGTRTTLALMPDWDTLDYGIQHQVLAHLPFAISSNIFHHGSFFLLTALLGAWIKTQRTRSSFMSTRSVFTQVVLGRMSLC